jgi:ubiquinone/menaquinone biosynthesis C-methylase UbiE
MDHHGQDKHIERLAFETFLQEDYESSWMKHDKVIRMLNLAPNPTRKFLLDAGTGTGAWGIRLARGGFNVVGVDLSLVELKKAKLNAIAFNDGNGSYDVVQCDVERLPIRDQVFDLCFCGGVLHHLPNPRDAIMELTRATGGESIVAFEPNGQNPYRRGVRRVMKLLPNWTVQKGFSTPNETLHSLKSYIRIFRDTKFSSVWYKCIRWPKMAHSSKIVFLDDCIRNTLWNLLPERSGGDTALIVAMKG